MDPDKAKKLLELSARYAPAVKAAEARRGQHRTALEPTSEPKDPVHFSGEKGKMVT